MKIEICIHTYNYQKRLSWMLSSLLQQEGNIPELIANISYTENDGPPTTKSLIDFFRNKGLNIKETLVPFEQIHNRAYARNIQIKDTDADWLIFADSDMVYCKLFFDDLQKQLNTNLKDITKVMGGDRISFDENYCAEYFDNDKTEYPCVVENVDGKFEGWPIKWVMGRKYAAGNFQLVNVNAVKDKGSIYSNASNDVWRYTKSDRNFRVLMGGRCGIDIKPMYHLNHRRASPDKKN